MSVTAISCTCAGDSSSRETDVFLRQQGLPLWVWHGCIGNDRNVWAHPRWSGYGNDGTLLLSIPKITSSNPSGGSELTFRSDLLLTARCGSTWALIEFACLPCYLGNTLCSQRLEPPGRCYTNAQIYFILLLQPALFFKVFKCKHLAVSVGLEDSRSGTSTSFTFLDCSLTPPFWSLTKPRLGWEKKIKIIKVKTYLGHYRRDFWLVRWCLFTDFKVWEPQLVRALHVSIKKDDSRFWSNDQKVINRSLLSQIRNTVAQVCGRGKDWTVYLSAHKRVLRFTKCAIFPATLWMLIAHGR
jgi:hypothetical protein